MVIKLKEIEKGKFRAEYLDKKDIHLHGICQYGKTAFEAELNLRALLVTVKKERLRTTICNQKNTVF